MGIDFHVLGPIEVRRDGEVLKFPASAYGNLGGGTLVNVGETRLSCRHYDPATEKCTELVGQKTVSTIWTAAKQ